MNEVIFSSNDQDVGETSKNAYKEISEDGSKDSQKEEVRKALQAMGGDSTINKNIRKLLDKKLLENNTNGGLKLTDKRLAQVSTS